MDHQTLFQSPEISARLAERIQKTSRKEIRLMEVCGTHTVSIFRNGIRSLLPGSVSLISGPGCPVCVTSQADIDAFIFLAGIKGNIVATFGDLMRVPGTHGSLLGSRAAGGDVRVVYSPLDAVTLAAQNPSKNIVFLGVGFETTAPAIAAALVTARQRGVTNFFVYSAHKTVPPALTALMGLPGMRLDGLILPGHVSVIIGTAAYAPFVNLHRLPSVVAGFEPTDILQAIVMLVNQIEAGQARLENAYPRVVTPEGNRKARALMERVFEPVDAVWRGLGRIPDSGLRIAPAFGAFDAQRAFSVEVPESREPAGCACGEVLSGRCFPTDCPLFGKTCTPIHPVGPCMVSTEGTCAAYYRYF